MNLFSDFPSSNAAEWEKRILQDLKIQSIEELYKKNGPLLTHPFYTKESNSKGLSHVKNESKWETCDYLHVTNEKEANKDALEALKGGASGLVFNISKECDLDVLLKNISVEHIYTQFNISNDSLHVLKDLKKYALKKNKDNPRTTCFINLDPLYLLAKFGEWHASEREDLAQIDAMEHIAVNGIQYKEAGANAVTELALILAHLNEYFNCIGEAKIKNKKIIHVSFAKGSDFFTEIAKLRAFRRLNALLQKQYGIEIPLHLHAQTALLNKSTLDAHTNLLRTTTEAMSAVIGGCDSLCVFPYDQGFVGKKEFSSRIARNQSHILREESYLDKVADIASGSYYIEHLTEDLADQAWKLFKKIETQDGFLTCLKTGVIQKMIEADAQILMNEVKEGKKTLVGVNKFQNKNQKEIPAWKVNKFKKKDVEPIAMIRPALLFEEQERAVKVN